MDAKRKNTTFLIGVVGGVIVTLILVLGTLWMGRSAQRDTETAVRAVSLLYLDELAGRREQVVASNLQDYIDNAQVAIGLMTPDDLSDDAHLQAYQARMKKLYKLKKFAFVDSHGVIHTSLGNQNNIDDYGFDYRKIGAAEISILNLNEADKKVVIALPVHIKFGDDVLVASFIEMDMSEMLRGASVQSSTEGTTFCNIYTPEGIALSNTVLGGLAVEDNLLEALQNAAFDEGYAYERVIADFAEGRRGVVSFTYDGIKETLSYVPVEGTDWMLTYLIRESVISEQISSISEGIIRRGIIQSLLTVAALIAVFTYIIVQNRRNARLIIESEAAAAENRTRQEELEQRLALQGKLLEEEKEREQQNRMISALASDYWSVYYVFLDADEGICYQPHSDIDDGFAAGERFAYLDGFASYAQRYVIEPFRDEFLQFIQPENVRARLAEGSVASYTYMVERHGRQSYEMVRYADAQRSSSTSCSLIRNVGVCFTDVDAETRKNLAQNQALSDALEAAERANNARTAFLSNMSHEIRTPMNAIISLDNIALNDPNTPAKTREYLEKIGGSAEHLLNLINDILDMSRIESGRLMLKDEEFSFSRLLEAVNTMFSGQCQDKGLDYQCHVKTRVDDYYIGDNMKLRQVLINILGNAVKFTPVGGKVELDVERTAQFDGKSTLRFTISDTGIGMSEEFLPHLFDTFSQEDSSTTSKYGSSGLGMAITKNIVEMMNGSIEVQSVKGEGTTFKVAVTLIDSKRQDAEDVEDVDPRDMSVLIIDDDPVACEHAQLVLGHAGIATETAASGAEGIEMVRLRHARRNPYNLILVDWQMPEMDGVETTRQIRSIVGDDSAIVILTAYRWDDVLEDALKAGVDSFIAKPVFAGAVLEEFISASKRKHILGRNAKHKAELAGRRVLLAEDMPVNAEIMSMVLEMREIKAELAVNGRIAVEMFAAHEPGYYDAVLMDMRMPEMDGLEATRTIRMLDRPDASHIPIIALTANAFDEDVQRSLQAGLNAHLSKPIEPDALFEALESLIDNEDEAGDATE